MIRTPGHPTELEILGARRIIGGTFSSASARAMAEGSGSANATRLCRRHPLVRRRASGAGNRKSFQNVFLRIHHSFDLPFEDELLGFC